MMNIYILARTRAVSCMGSVSSSPQAGRQADGIYTRKYIHLVHTALLATVTLTGPIGPRLAGDKANRNGRIKAERGLA